MPDGAFALARSRVEWIERISPTFARVTFAGPELHDIGGPGPVLDQRIKIVFPPPGGAVPRLPEDDDWWSAWLAVPEEERGSMRTYSIRSLEVGPTATRIVVDFVRHLAAGATGPASLWAEAAAPGDEVLLIGPRRGRPDAGGVEFDPGDAGTVLLAGDETAAPAIARILEDAGPGLRGAAFIEVPHAADALDVEAPAGVDVHWLPRDGAEHGAALIPAVLAHLGSDADAGAREPEGEELVWETPAFPAGDGAAVGAIDVLPADDPLDTGYVWIAGESGVVTTLRRRLVTDLGLPRRRVAFMGYWRRGVAMRA
ncbi:siderophore-interacting protein [Pseudolysinimonas sp.]|uniref:siderophore-interacting protein n=1 Tax=Pseudolysinimonas sp. TaxID=2680009 RepID=UPI003F8081BB